MIILSTDYDQQKNRGIHRKQESSANWREERHTDIIEQNKRERERERERERDRERQTDRQRITIWNIEQEMVFKIC